MLGVRAEFFLSVCIEGCIQMVRKMIPPAFRNMCVWLMSDIAEDIPEGQDMIGFAVARLTDDERRDARAFLEEILSEALSDQELIDIWFAAGARIGFMNEGDYRNVLRKALNRLSASSEL